MDDIATENLGIAKSSVAISSGLLEIIMAMSMMMIVGPMSKRAIFLFRPVLLKKMELIGKYDDLLIFISSN